VLLRGGNAGEAIRLDCVSLRIGVPSCVGLVTMGLIPASPQMAHVLQRVASVSCGNLFLCFWPVVLLLRCLQALKVCDRILAVKKHGDTMCAKVRCLYLCLYACFCAFGAQRTRAGAGALRTGQKGGGKGVDDLLLPFACEEGFARIAQRDFLFQS
jgi:hypothetical protein